MPCGNGRREGDVNSSIRDDVTGLIATQELVCGNNGGEHGTGLGNIVQLSLAQHVEHCLAATVVAYSLPVQWQRR